MNEVQTQKYPDSRETEMPRRWETETVTCAGLDRNSSLLF